jgi:hypothetical protein
MFQFPRFAFVSYVFRHKYLLLISANPRLAPQRPCGPSSPRLEITEIEGGFPHSEIRGSKLVRSSPRLNAAYHVLHRLSAPRHPPNTLKALDRSHYRRPLRKIRIELRSERPFASNISKSLAVKRDPRWSLASVGIEIPQGRLDMFPLHDDRQHARLASDRREPWRTRLTRETFQDERWARIAADRPSGGARRDRTDDLMLAKHALSQLSYGPGGAHGE